MNAYIYMASFGLLVLGWESHLGYCFSGIHTYAVILNALVTVYTHTHRCVVIYIYARSTVIYALVTTFGHSYIYALVTLLALLDTFNWLFAKKRSIGCL